MAQSLSEMVSLMRADFNRYRGTGGPSGFVTRLKNPSYTPIFWYRLSFYLATSKTAPLWKLPVNVIMRRMEIKYGIRIPPRVPIGPGLAIWHSGLTVLHYDSVIGSNCNLRQGVTIGHAGRGENKGVPVLGNRVDVGVNAVLIGKITIGDDAVIGAGAIIRNDVPPPGRRGGRSTANRFLPWQFRSRGVSGHGYGSGTPG